MWIQKEIQIGQIKDLIQNGDQVEVWSPDGWVSVNSFVDKGMWDEYVLTTENNKLVKCNENHLFKTVNGWWSAKEIYNFNLYNDFKVCVNTDQGLSRARVELTGNQIPIVDIEITHENHRYYTAGIESHNTGVGKTLAMCHFAASHLAAGKNVLYITLEMAEEKIAERIDANLLDIPLDELYMIPKDIYDRRMQRLREHTLGKLKIKEFPTSGAGTANFRHLLNELKLKGNFIPDIIYVDYLNICISSRLKMSSNVNSYTYIKAIAEELRGLAIEFNVPIVSATQTTRSGFDNSDVSLTDTSECLDPTSKVIKTDGSHVELQSLNPGDKILGSRGFTTVIQVHHKQIKKMFKITTKSGKAIVCSADHVFPTLKGRLSIKTGLKVGDRVQSI